MKRFKKLHVQTGQELSAAMQQGVLAGEFISPWSGNCSCSVVGDSHTENRVYKYYATNVGGIVSGVSAFVGATGLGALAGGFAGAGYGALTGLGGLVYAYSCINEEVTMHYYRKMEVTGVDPLQHRIASEWSI